MTVDIKASFSAKEKPNNGLEAIAAEIAADPLTPRYAIVRYFCPHTKVDNLNGGALTPVAQFDVIEPMLSDVDEKDARRLLESSYKARTGKLPAEPLPLPPPAGDDEPELPLSE